MSINIKDSSVYQKLINSKDLSLLQFCKLINQLLIEFNKATFTREDFLNMFYEAFDNWIYQESINDSVTTIIKPYLKALNNFIDEQILKSIVNSVLQNISFDSLNDEFMTILIPKLMYKLGNNNSIFELSFRPIQSYYFSTLIKKYKYNEFTDIIDYIIESQIDDRKTKARRPLNPNEFQYLTDKEDPIDNTLTSTIEPISFNKFRTCGIVVLDKKVLAKNKDHVDIINDYREYCKQHKVRNYNSNGNNILEEFGISTLAVGSAFGKAVLLEYITSSDVDTINSGKISSNNGNLDMIKSALKAKGYEKIYLQKGSPFVSRKYVRKAKKQIY